MFFFSIINFESTLIDRVLYFFLKKVVYTLEQFFTYSRCLHFEFDLKLIRRNKTSKQNCQGVSVQVPAQKPEDFFRNANMFDEKGFVLKQVMVYLSRFQRVILERFKNIDVEFSGTIGRSDFREIDNR